MFNRRSALKVGAATLCSCLAGCAAPTLAERKRLSAESTESALAKAEFGGLHEIRHGIYAFIATPFGPQDRPQHLQAHSNAGVIVGRDGILVVDALRTPQAAAWLSTVIAELTGRRVTHVVSTHFHFDHIGGILGFAQGGNLPRIYQTQRMRGLARETYGPISSRAGSTSAIGESRLQQLGGIYVDPTDVILEGSQTFQIDLGDRIVSIREFVGHTASDLVVEDEETGVIFAGDLIWNGIFPNFMSAEPAHWAGAVRELLRKKRTLVPGHGPLGITTEGGLRSYGQLFDLIEDSARRAYEQGLSAEEAARRFRVPEELGRWRYFKPGFHESAFKKWLHALSDARV